MKETKILEFKEVISATFLKTVSAYANYGTGRIMFGVSDKGEARGVPAPQNACLDIENRINDSIEPVPRYTLSVDGKTNIITLTVYEGPDKPYLYKAKAYRRADTATVPVDRLEMTRLILEGRNISYEELPARKQHPTFSQLERRLKDVMNLNTFTIDTLKTLELFSDAEGYNNAAMLLADENEYPGVDMVRFGENINVLTDRETIEHVSILSQYDRALVMYKRYYQYERISGDTRTTESIIPEEAFREALANALVHRMWDVDAHINVAMYADRIEITSPGGLPSGIDREEYLRGGISLPRNRIIAGVFYRLRMIERFGTGIRRINETYTESLAKPQYALSDNSIRVTLPAFKQDQHLSEDEQSIFLLIGKNALSSSDICKVTGFGKTKVVGILKRLISEGYARQIGTGRGTKYTTG